MRPDTIPVRPLASRAVVPTRQLATLFGEGARLTSSAQVEVVHRGEVVAWVPVEVGDPLALVVDATVHVEGSVALRGLVGAIGPVQAAVAQSRLVLPEGIVRAWGLSETAVLGLGAVAVAVPIEIGPAPVAHIEHALWLGAGRPGTARWLPGVSLSSPTPPADDGLTRLDAKVITETDVRQARLKRRQIQVRADQIVTPAARSLAREWNVLVTA